MLFKRKKIIIAVILLAIIGSYFGWRNLRGEKEVASYVTAAVEKGTLIVSVEGSGQVSVSDQIDIKPKISGDVVYVGVKNGQEVKAGALLAQIDSPDAQKAIRDAKTNLQTAKLELEELLQPADAYSLMQAENALIQTKDNLTKLKFTQESNYQDTLDAIEKAEDNLEKAYEDTSNTIANAFLDLPTLITNLRDILYSYEIAKNESTLSNYQWNISVFENSVDYVDYNDRVKLEKFIESAEGDYKSAREKYDKNFENYKEASRYSDKEVIEALLDETLETTKAMAETVKSETNMLDYWVDYRSDKDLRVFSKVTEYQSDLKSYTSKTNSHLSSLLSIQRTVEDNKESKINAERDIIEMDQNNPLDLTAAQRSIKEKEEALAKLKADPDELDIRVKRIAIQQKEDALLDARENLADHYIRVPFDGVVAEVNAKKGESASSGTAIVTLITKQKIAEITLNEIDIAKVKTGQKTTITFDAIENLSITGEVAEIDTLGMVSQGVVSYNVKIAFDTQDERVKSGMSISTEIITDLKQNVLLVPNSALKYQGDIQYVEVMENETPRSQGVEVGLSNDTMSEVVSGLQEGNKVITQTTGQVASQEKNSSAPAGMDMMRMMR